MSIGLEGAAPVLPPRANSTIGGYSEVGDLRCAEGQRSLPPSVGVATITWARTVDEAELLRHSFSELARATRRLSVADRGNDPDFAAFLRTFDGVRCVTPHAPGLVAQVQASIAAAAEYHTDWILYSEPDKQSFFAGPMQSFVRRALNAGNAGIALPARTAESFATFPPMQRYTESVLNRLLGEMTGTTGDYLFGPLLIHRTLLHLIRALPDDLGWGWRPAIVLAACRLAQPIVLLADDYPCPEEMRSEDEGDRQHRIRQLIQNLRGLVP
jgi:hypothetical protein